MSPQDIENAKREGKKMSEHINKSQESLSDKKIEHLDQLQSKKQTVTSR